MLQTANITSKLDEIPIEWVFEHYLKLPEKLIGQDIRMASVFNHADKTPSMFVFCAKKTKRYNFKCFSTGAGGDGTTLVREMFNLTSKGEAAHKIIEDYNQWLLSNQEDYSLREFKEHSKYQVKSHKNRGWTIHDRTFWTKFKIGSKMLEKYIVVPIDRYTLEKEINGEIKTLVIHGICIYGFYKKDGTLYKIYQPLVKDSKFIQIHSYVQGSEQLTYEKPYLVITSSLKDLMDFDLLGFSNAESIAPDSENTLIPDVQLKRYLEKYQGVCTIFDNDEPGRMAAARYQVKYGIKAVKLELAKDLSDSVRDLGLNKVRETLIPILREALMVEIHKDLPF